MTHKTIGILTGGGDCPGLNAVIRGFVTKAVSQGYKVVGFRRGFAGLMPDGGVTTLDLDDVHDIQMAGGTILGTSHLNPLDATNGPEGIKAGIKRHEVSAVAVVGGRSTLGYAETLSRQYGIPIVGVPKTINNDLSGTDFCFGFFTAVTNATETLDRLVTFARSHEQVMVIEVKGGRSGSLAYYAGVASGANMILVPEAPFTVAEILELVRRRREEGQASSMIVVAEGCWPTDLSEAERPERKRPADDESMVATVLADLITRKTNIPSEAMVLDTLLRSGQPAGFDRVLGMRFGIHAADLCMAGKTGRMVALHGSQIDDVPLAEALVERPLDPALAAQSRLFRD